MLDTRPPKLGMSEEEGIGRTIAKQRSKRTRKESPRMVMVTKTTVFATYVGSLRRVKYCNPP